MSIEVFVRELVSLPYERDTDLFGIIDKRMKHNVNLGEKIKDALSDRVFQHLNITDEDINWSMNRFKIKKVSDFISGIVRFPYRAWIMCRPKLVLAIAALEENTHHIFKDRILNIPNNVMSYCDFRVSLLLGELHEDLTFFRLKPYLEETPEEQYINWAKETLNTIRDKITVIIEYITRIDSCNPVPIAALEYGIRNINHIDNLISIIHDPLEVQEYLFSHRDNIWFTPPDNVIKDTHTHFKKLVLS